MNHLAIAMIVGEQHVRREVDHVRWVDEGTIQAEEVFQRGAKVMLAELLKTHAIIPRSALVQLVEDAGAGADFIAKTEVKP